MPAAKTKKKEVNINSKKWVEELPDAIDVYIMYVCNLDFNKRSHTTYREVKQMETLSPDAIPIQFVDEKWKKLKLQMKRVFNEEIRAY